MAAIPEATVEHTLEPIPTAVADIADLARRDAERTPQPYTLYPDRSLVLIKVRNDERVDTHDLEPYLDNPNRCRGRVTVHDPNDFTDYVNRLANPDYSTAWADVDAGTVTAVINDHATWDDAGWRDHIIQLRLQPDEDWRKWAARDGKLVEQADFAEFVEDVAHGIVDPDAATMLEIALTMSGKRSVEFSQGTRQQTGDIQLKFEETTQANAGVKGQLEIPERITVQLAPWRGVIVADLPARLRWRINNGKLFIGYKLLRPELFASDVFNGLVDRIRENLHVPLYRGATPNSLR
jgi:uncharacterized protein YfdQ (DUF2303 family)